MSDPIRLLVAEDDSEMRILLRKILSREGYEVVLASDGTEAVDRLRAGEPFDLLMTDIRMPRKDGMEVLRDARQLRPNLRVILITAYADVDQFNEVMREGAFEYLPKPFKIPELLAILERALGRTPQPKPAT